MRVLSNDKVRILTKKELFGLLNLPVDERITTVRISSGGDILISTSVKEDYLNV